MLPLRSNYQGRDTLPWTHPKKKFGKKRFDLSAGGAEGGVDFPIIIETPYRFFRSWSYFPRPVVYLVRPVAITNILG